MLSQGRDGASPGSSATKRRLTGLGPASSEPWGLRHQPPIPPAARQRSGGKTGEEAKLKEEARRCRTRQEGAHVFSRIDLKIDDDDDDDSDKTPSELAAKEGWGEALRADRQSALRGGGGVETAGRRAQKMPSISCSESRRCCHFRTEIRPSIPCSQSRKCCHFRTEISPGGGIEITGGGVKSVMNNHKGAPRSWGHKGQNARFVFCGAGSEAGKVECGKEANFTIVDKLSEGATTDFFPEWLLRGNMRNSGSVLKKEKEEKEMP